MVLDITAVKTFLRLNGLSEESPEPEIRSLLSKAHYSDEEISAFINATHGSQKEWSVFIPPTVRDMPAGVPPVQVPSMTVQMPSSFLPPVAPAVPPPPPEPEYTKPTYRVPAPDPVQKAAETVHAERFLTRFRGRISRENFALGTLALLGALVILLLVQQTLKNVPALMIIICVPLLGVVLLVALSMNIRRLHDLGHPGEMAFICIVPYVNIAFWIYLLIKKGEPAENAYGRAAQDVPFVRAALGKV